MSISKVKYYIIFFLFSAALLAAMGQAVLASSPEMAEVTVSGLNMRTGPGTGHTRIRILNRGTILTVLGQQGEWLQTRLANGNEGWIFGGNGFAARHVVLGNYQVTADILNVRSGRGTNHPRISRLTRGTLVPALAEQDGWFRVALPQGNAGWVLGQFLTPDEPPAPDDDTPPLEGRTIVVDPGHGGHDPGAVGRVHTLTEKYVNLDTGLRLAALLEEAGATVVMTRRSDIFIPLQERVNIAHNNNADIFVSIHANAHIDRSINGTETYYNSTNFRSQESFRLASLLQQELVRELNLRNIGTKTANFHVIRNNPIPSALVEMAFISNAREEELLRQPAFRQRAAESIFRGILRYFH